jgi:hypothetical protein
MSLVGSRMPGVALLARTYTTWPGMAVERGRVAAKARRVAVGKCIVAIQVLDEPKCVEENLVF